jgi:hypothetical protein
VSYRVDRVSGQVATQLSGLTDPDLCGPLDACGLMGSVTATPSASSGEAFIYADASARHSWRDLRRAVGLSAGRPPRGVSTFGFVGWTRDTGAVTSDLTRNGAPACTDSEPLSAGGVVSLRFSRRAVGAAYGDPDQSGDGLLATRCPGPLLTDAAGSGALATTSVPLSAFRARRVTLRLQDGHSYSSDGYHGITTADLSVTMHRTGVKRELDVYTVTVSTEFARARAHIRARLAR